MDLSFTIPAMLIGLGGSLHCIGMCGPLMFSTVLQTGNNTFPLSRWLIYQTGRILTYAAWGALFGFIGISVKWFGWQQNMSLGLGISMLLVLIMLKFFPAWETAFASNKLSKSLSKTLLPHVLAQTPVSAFLGGVLNGTLPCGLVYMAMAGATVMQDPFKGGLFMVAFGTGTLPLLLAVWIAGRGLQANIRKYVATAYPYILACMAVLLIIRGLNLGTVFSPAINPEKTGIIHCSTE
jgi:sulfite exporter TauE/SafE